MQIRLRAVQTQLRLLLNQLAHRWKVGGLAGSPSTVSPQDLNTPKSPQQVERMRRQVDYHLAHARAAASGATPGARCSVADSAEGLSRTWLRLHAGRGLTITVRISPEHSVRCQREDLDEMLGNLLDNAGKWAKTRVTVESSEANASLVITVDDDGRGLAPSMGDVVLQRGVRADEAAPGSGFGLAIVRDLAELYGGSIVLGSSTAAGVRAHLQLPSC